jgi:uncharacterized protein YjbI with pentapeptide repeats
MANEEHLARLRQGVKAWNRWREANLNINPDLTEVNLAEMNLTRANLAGMRLTETRLRMARLISANLSGADLTRADLFGANLTEAHLIRTNLTEAYLIRTNLTGAYLKSTKFIDTENRIVLFPLRIDEAVMHSTVCWAADIRRQRHIGDFRHWTNHNAYQQAFQRLLLDLKADI